MKMECNNELKETKNKNHTDYYFDDVANINDLDRNRVLLDKTSHKNILIYDVAYKAQCGAKSLCIIFDKVDAYIGKYNRTKYLTLFHSEKI